MAMVRAIEEGDSSWSSNFQMLEVLVMGEWPKAVHKLSKPISEAHTESKEGKKLLFCKKYQLDECQADLKNNTHWGTLGGKSWLLHHVRATCLLKYRKDFHKLGWLLQDIGVWESEHKACPPSSLMVVLGIMFNTIDMTISISPEKVDEIQAELDSCTTGPRYLISSWSLWLGNCSSCSTLSEQVVLFAHLLHELRGSQKWGYIAVPVSIMQDIKWWQYIMPTLNGTKSIYLDVFLRKALLLTQMPLW